MNPKTRKATAQICEVAEAHPAATAAVYAYAWFLSAYYTGALSGVSALALAGVSAFLIHAIIPYAVEDTRMEMKEKILKNWGLSELYEYSQGHNALSRLCKQLWQELGGDDLDDELNVATADGVCLFGMTINQQLATLWIWNERWGSIPLGERVSQIHYRDAVEECGNAVPSECDMVCPLCGEPVGIDACTECYEDPVVFA